MRLRRIAVATFAAVLASLAAGACVLAAGEPIVETLRAVSIRVTAPRALIAFALLAVTLFAIRHNRERLASIGFPRRRATGDFPSQAVVKLVEHPVARVAILGALVGAVAALRIVAVRANALPHVFSDELIFSSLGRGIAAGDGLVVRGVDSAGYGVLYPLLISPAYALAADGARAYENVQAVNSLVMCTAAIPAYMLARRALTPTWSLVAAGLAIVMPAMGYSSVVMTEAVFYPVFLLFALTLVRALESPSTRRQLVMVATLAALCGIRVQAVALVPAICLAVVLTGLPNWMPFVRRFAPTWLSFAIVAAAALIVSGGDPAASLGAYRVLLSDVDLLAIPGWAAKNLAALELSVGIVAFALLPAALADLLKRSSPVGHRALAAVTLSTTLALAATVAVLSASPYGLGRLHERNVFYVLPLIVICALAWLSRGPDRRYGMVAAGGVVLAIALPITLTGTDYMTAAGQAFDTPSLGRWDDLAGHSISPRVAIGSAAAVIAVAALLVRSRWILAATVLIAFMGTWSQLDYQSTLPRSEVRELAWVDHALPSGSRALLVHGGLSARCARSTVDQLGLWTEFFNLSVRDVGHLARENPAPGMGSPSLRLDRQGHLVREGRLLDGGYFIVDSRVPLAGRPLGTIRWRGGSHPIGDGPAQLTLWRAAGPARLSDPEWRPYTCGRPGRASLPRDRPAQP